MKIRYEFANGEVTEVEVSEEVGAVIVESRREEENLARKNRYHCYSLDAIDYEGAEYADPHTPEGDYISRENKEVISRALACLTETQRRRLMLYAGGLSYREIARREGVDHKKVIKSVEAAKEKLKKLFD